VNSVVATLLVSLDSPLAGILLFLALAFVPVFVIVLLFVFLNAGKRLGGPLDPGPHAPPGDDGEEPPRR